MKTIFEAKKLPAAHYLSQEGFVGVGIGRCENFESFLESLDASEALQRREALVYLLMLIFHRRPMDEREELVRLVEERTSDKEVSTMAETTAEFLLARGIERGARETTIENILSVLTTRFPSADVNTLKPALEAIADLNRLKQLLLNASLANSFQAFQHGL